MRWLRVVFGLFAVLFLVGAGAALWWRAEILLLADAVRAVMDEPEWADIADAERLIEWIEAHPDDLSLMVASVDPTGALVEPLAYQADTPRVLASTMKIVVLSAWARAVEDGALAEDATVALGDWDSWYLPGLDGGAHPSAYDRLGVAHTGGVAHQPQQRLPLDQVVGAMIRESDNAATDLLIALLGPRLDAETQRLGHQPIGPLLAGTVEALGGGDPCVARAPIDLSDPVERAAVLDRGPPSVGLSTQLRVVPCVLPRGSARVYAQIMAGVVTHTHISEPASARMAEHLQWPNPSRRFEVIGTKGGSVPGVLTEATYYVPTEGPYAGQPRVVALFLNDLSGSSWVALMGSFAQQQLAARLATDPELVERLGSRLGSP